MFFCISEPIRELKYVHNQYLIEHICYTVVKLLENTAVTVLGLILYSLNNCTEAALYHQEMLWIGCRGDTEYMDKHSQI